jgi:hypothetical protein
VPRGGSGVLATLHPRRGGRVLAPAGEAALRCIPGFCRRILDPVSKSVVAGGPAFGGPADGSGQREEKRVPDEDAPGLDAVTRSPVRPRGWCLLAQQGPVGAREAGAGAQSERELRIQDNRSQDAALKVYLDRMNQLLLNRGLRESREGDKVHFSAWARTITALSRLDSRRKVSVLRFLYEARLIAKYRPVINLDGAGLRYAFVNPKSPAPPSLGMTLNVKPSKVSRLRIDESASVAL